jgi:hypothetical protein
MTIGSMVEDSIVKKFSGITVSVAGADVWNSTDAAIKQFIDVTHITFTVAKNGDSIEYFYSSDGYSIVVIDKDGIVQFMQQLTTTVVFDDKTVSDAATIVRSLLETGIVRFKATTAIAVRKSNSLPRYYTLSGQTITHPIPSVRAGIALRRLDGRVTGIVRFAKPNP